jgi:hypothetical protein
MAAALFWLSTHYLRDVADWHCMVHRTVLGTFSEYFRTRVTGWDDDPHTLRGKDGRPVLMVAVEPELTEAAHAVVRMMYNAVVRDGISGKELAQVSLSVGDLH